MASVNCPLRKTVPTNRISPSRTVFKNNAPASSTDNSGTGEEKSPVSISFSFKTGKERKLPRNQDIGSVQESASPKLRIAFSANGPENPRFPGRKRIFPPFRSWLAEPAWGNLAGKVDWRSRSMTENPSSDSTRVRFFQKHLPFASLFVNPIENSRQFSQYNRKPSFRKPPRGCCLGLFSCWKVIPAS